MNNGVYVEQVHLIIRIFIVSFVYINLEGHNNCKKSKYGNKCPGRITNWMQ